ncbi:MAG: YbaB/EbfC family nucleoid-associated protein [Micromonosporaceae bacterium]
MQAEWRAQIETMLDDYRRLRDGLAGLGAALADLTETARSADGTVTVTVDRSGRLICLDLHPAYRPDQNADELAARIVATAGVAAQQVTTRARTLIGETLPPRYVGVLAGDNGISDLLPGDPDPTQPVMPR